MPRHRARRRKWHGKRRELRPMHQQDDDGSQIDGRPMPQDALGCRGQSRPTRPDHRDEGRACQARGDEGRGLAERNIRAACWQGKCRLNELGDQGVELLQLQVSGGAAQTQSLRGREVHPADPGRKQRVRLAAVAKAREKAPEHLLQQFHTHGPAHRLVDDAVGPKQLHSGPPHPRSSSNPPRGRSGRPGPFSKSLLALSQTTHESCRRPGSTKHARVPATVLPAPPVQHRQELALPASALGWPTARQPRAQESGPRPGSMGCAAPRRQHGAPQGRPRLGLTPQRRHFSYPS